MDGDPGRVADGPSSGRLGHCGGCSIVPRSRMSLGAQVPCLQGPISSSGTQGGGGVHPRLLSFAGRAMAIGLLTQLHISIPASGAAPGQVPEVCFPVSTPPQKLTSPRRVSFARDVTVLGGAPPLYNSPDIILHDPPCPEIADEDDMDTIGATTDISAPIVRPPLGFRQFSWPREEWSVDGKPSLFDFAKELPGWFPWRYGEQPVDPPSLPVSPIPPGSLDDSVIANVSPDVVGTFSELPLGPVADSPQGLTNHGSRRSLDRVPRWRLAREGPFIAEISSSSLRSFGAGCAFRIEPRTTLRHPASLAFL